MHERNNWSNLVSGANLLRGSAHSQFPIQVSSVRKFGQNMGGVQDKERQGQVKFFLQNTSFLLSSLSPPPHPTPAGKCNMKTGGHQWGPFTLVKKFLSEAPAVSNQSCNITLSSSTSPCLSTSPCSTSWRLGSTRAGLISKCSCSPPVGGSCQGQE